jgi:exopolysaccharide biosynthesis polyprenyl glycosylphosphotransferase
VLWRTDRKMVKGATQMTTTSKASERISTEQSSTKAAGARPRNVLIVGAGARGRALARQIHDHPEHGLSLVGFVDDGFVDDDPTRAAGINGYKMLGRTSAVMEVIRNHAIDEILISYDASFGEQILDKLMLAGQEDKVIVKKLPTLYDAIVSRVPLQTINDIPFFQVNGRKPQYNSAIDKRLPDVLLASALLLVFMPLLLVCALIIWVSSGGPVLFRQRRLGLRGREFTMYKLRTMIAQAEADTGPVLSTPGDERVTPFGRFLRDKHLDELPQLFNVLRGDMSMVGPRPERPEFVVQYAEHINGYRKRLEVKPGLTGLAQVYGGYSTDVYDKMKYDWAYIYHRSFVLDLKLLWLTFVLVVWPARKAQLRSSSPKDEVCEVRARAA